MVGFSRIGPSIRRSPEVQRAGLVVAFVIRLVVGLVVRLVVGLGVVVRLGHQGVADERASPSPPEPVAAM
jgi:hypothetical protein